MAVRDQATGALLIGEPERPIEIRIAVADLRTNKGGIAIVALPAAALNDPFPVLVQEHVVPALAAAMQQMVKA